MKSTALRQSFAKGSKQHKAAMHLIPNLFTTGNLFCGVFAILSVFNANYMAAAIAILVAMIFDVLDGKSARLTNSTSHFGLEYDSLSDVVSFGVAPGLLLYSWALSGQGTFGIAVMFAYVAMGAVRLARFNATAMVSDGRYFTGLAIPAAAGVVASMVIFALSTLETGHPAFALSAAVLKASALAPGIFAVTSRCTAVIVQPASSFSMVSVADVAMLSGVRFAAPNCAERAIEKHAACAAAISSSGFVPGVFSKRVVKE